MQVTSLFATFFAFLTLVVPLATQALQITVPSSLAPGNNTIKFTSEPSDSAESLTFVLVKNATQETVAQDVAPSAGTVTVTIPENTSGSGWSIQAFTDEGTEKIGSSTFFEITSPTPSSMSNAGVIVGGVCAAVVVVALIVLAVFLYTRRRRHERAATSPTFNIEAGFPAPRDHTRSLSSTSSGSEDAESKARDMETEKAQWEMQLEAQFARARAGTPDISRGLSPMPPRGASPMGLRGVSPMGPRGASPLRNPPPPQRAVTRDTTY
ncbi:hypothetical protein B0H11DRAFT_1376560 [Mycena galericulata]|nr:hypothetical protein B0H11DRAFT_1376560 [Mycena galericulata]